MAEWEGIPEFVAVAEAESFTAAARRLGSSIAHVSRKISALENRLCTRLFHRTTRKVSLTAEGRIYYRHCRPILDSLEEAERALGNLQRHPAGTLRLTAPVAYGERYIAPLLNDFALSYPALEVDLLLTNQPLDLVEEGLDLAIRLGELDNDRLVARKLASRTQHVCGSPAYLARRGRPRTLSDLAHHNCLLGTLNTWRFVDAGQSRTLRVSGSLRCNSGPALLDAALKGIGLVQLPDYYVLPAIGRGELVCVLERYCRDTEGIWALYPPNRHLSSKVRMLIAFLEERLPPGAADKVSRRE